MLLMLLTGVLWMSLSLAALGWLPAWTTGYAGLGFLLGVAAVALLRRSGLAWFSACLVSTACWSLLLAPDVGHVDFASLHGGLARVALSIERGGCGDRGCFSEAELTHCSELEPASCLPPGTRIGVASARELPNGADITALAHLKPRVAFYNPSPGLSWPDTRPEAYAELETGAEPRIDRVFMTDAWLAQARDVIRTSLGRTLAAPHAGIARALLLGEGAAVEPTLNDAIRAAGVSHVLAVSGMHVTLLVGAWVLALRWLWLRTPWALHWEAKRVAAAFGVVLAPLLARLCGGSPSAVRAAGTSTVMYLLVALGLRPHALAVSAFVVAVHAALAPRDALHPGFVLSVLATAALLSATAAHPGSRVTSALRESLRAWLATAPFLWLCFGQTSLVALLANVALLPLGGALVPLAAVHAVGAQLQLATVVPSAPLFSLASAAFVEASRFAASLDPGLTLPPLTAVELLCLCSVCACLMFRGSLRLRATVVGSAALLSGLCEWQLRHPLAQGTLRVTFLDVGQGDATLIETAEGARMLIDAGGALGGGPDPGARALLPLLRGRRIDRLDLVVLSHPHPDHYGGLFALLEALPVGELWDTGQAEAEDAGPEAPVARLLALARTRGTRIVRPDDVCNRTRTLGTARLEVLSPCPGFDMALGPNDNSFVLRLSHATRSFVFMGDAEHAAEEQLLARGALSPCDVLKVGHHGSRTSSTEALLRALAPRLAVISAGRANRFGHPHAEVAARLATHAHVMRIDQRGGVEVVSAGGRLTARGALETTNWLN